MWLLVCLLFSQTTFAGPHYVPGISGMALVEDNTYLVVNDKKDGPNDEPRLSIVRVKKAGVSYESVILEGLGIKINVQNKPNDLEAVCKIPGTTDEYLIAESGYFSGDYGRILHIKVEQKKDKWVAKYINSFKPFPVPPSGETPKEDHIEGMACVEAPNGDLIFILAKRGKNAKLAELVLGKLSPAVSSYNFTRIGSSNLTPVAGYGRGAGDIYLKSISKNRWHVWSVATEDGSDVGPFRSLIYYAGDFVVNTPGNYQFTLTHPYTNLWKVDGMKVEALAEPAEVISSSVLSIGTDEDVYGGVWRPLFEVN